MEWVPAPTPINENRRSKAVEKTGIIGTDQIYLFDIYVEIAKDISGYDAGSFSLYDSKNQCMISEIGKPGPIERHRRADKSASVCSYVLLDKKNLPCVCYSPQSLRRAPLQSGFHQIYINLTSNSREIPLVFMVKGKSHDMRALALI